MAALGNGAAFGVRIRWSLEPEPLETAGGIVTALPLLPPGPALIVSGDIWTRFDYATLAAGRRDGAESPRLRASISSWCPIRPSIPMAISSWPTAELH